jgi:hypothetical protein
MNATKELSTKHNLPVGPVKSCQVCGSTDLELIIDLGHQPLCDSLLSDSELDQPEQTYPLRFVRCLDCALTQIDYAVAQEDVYHRAYPYRSGITRELVEYQQTLADMLYTRLGLSPVSLVVDIGSNDGTLLKGFQQRGCRITGVEPTDIANYANADGIPTLQRPFDIHAAEIILGERGPASLITATNVFAHMASLGSVMEGMLALLDDDGVVMIENHYLLQVLTRTQYDTIYHEHLRTYCLKSLVCLFGLYEMEVFDATEVSRYGGNIRVLVCRKGKRPIDKSVAEMLDQEREAGLYRPEVYRQFAQKTRQSRDSLLRFFIEALGRRERVVGNSCPGRCSTLLNYVGIGSDMLPYIAEQPTSLKLGLYLPGKHIPVVNNEILLREQPENVLLLAWHYGRPIAEQLRARGLRSKLVMPLPELHVLDI